MNPPGLIPIPPRVRWREFRERWLPLFGFGLAAIAALGLWRMIGETGPLAGIGEGHAAAVLCHRAGWVSEVLVQPWQTVKRGDPIAVIKPFDPSAQLDLMSLEMEIARLRRQATVPEQNVVGYERARMEWLRLQAELATAKVKLTHAENDARRSQPLFERQLVSAATHELAVRERDIYQAEVAEKAKAVAEMEARLQTLRPLGDPFLIAAGVTNTGLPDRLERERLAWGTNLEPVVLRAPVDGVAGSLPRRAGEFVFEGELVAQVLAPGAERIVAYLRQPYAVDPEIGMAVTVATRTRHKQRFRSAIIQVGAQCEYITNALAYLRPGSYTDVGLPIVIGIPPGIRIRPGEQVDLSLHPRAAAP
jgi:multidrug resistance efflux pump